MRVFSANNDPLTNAVKELAMAPKDIATTSKEPSTILVRMLEKRLVFVREIVTHSPFGEDEPRPRRIAFYHLAQAANAHVHGAHPPGQSYFRTAFGIVNLCP